MKKMIKDYLDNDYKFDKTTMLGIIFLIVVFAGLFGWVYEFFFYYLNSGLKTFYWRGGNFLPWINIYAYGALLIFFLTYKRRKKPLQVFLISSLVCGLLELASGYVLYGLLGLERCWSYNEEILNFGNIGGYVCLRSVLVFGLSALMLIYLIVPLIFKLAKKMNKKAFMVLSISLFSIFIFDELYNLIFARLLSLPRSNNIYKSLGMKYIYFKS